MKTLQTIAVIAVLGLTIPSSCAPSYFGKSYTATQTVEVYYSDKDVKKEYEIMGSTEIPQGFSSPDAMQQKAIELGKSRGADGVIMKMVEETTGSSTSNFGNVKNGNKNNTYTGGSVTNNMKVKKIQATFIKYK